MVIVLSEPTGPGSGGGSNRSIETGRIGKPIMLLHSESVVRNTAPGMIKRTGLKRWPRSRTVNDVGTLYDFRTRRAQAP